MSKQNEDSTSPAARIGCRMKTPKIDIALCGYKRVAPMGGHLSEAAQERFTKRDINGCQCSAVGPNRGTQESVLSCSHKPQLFPNFSNLKFYLHDV